MKMSLIMRHWRKYLNGMKVQKEEDCFLSLICMMFNILHLVIQQDYICWKNWYRVWRNGCDTTDSQMSPQPRRSRGCGDIWESVVSQPWPKMRYQFLFYHGTTKLPSRYESLSSQTASQLFKEQSHCKHWVTWPDCFATPSNHCDVTTGPVSLICIDTW